MTGTDATGFGRLWTATGVANLADGILLAGLPVLATTITTDPAPVAGVMTVFMTAMGVAALPAGLLADRGDRRQVMVITNVLRAGTLLAVLAVAAVLDVRLALLYVVAALCGAAEIVNDVTAETAVPELVGDAGLPKAHGRLAATQVVLNDGVGAPLGGVLAAAGVGWVLGVPAALYASGAVAGALLVLRPRPARAAPGLASLRRDVVDGLAALRADPVLSRMAAAATAMNVANTAFFSVAVLLVIGPMGLPRSSYGLILTALAVGGIIGGALADRLVAAIGTGRAIMLGPMAMAGGYAAICLVPRAEVAVPALLILSAAGMAWNVTSRVLRARRIPPVLLGRVSTSIRLVSVCATPLGGVLAGLVAQVAGVRAVGWITGAAGLAALAILRPASRRLQSAEAHQPPGPTLHTASGETTYISPHPEEVAR